MGRFSTALKAFWMIWRRRDCADAWAAFLAQPARRAEIPSISADAVYTLSLLQREGRLVDFLKEPIDGYQDAQVGAAVRQIHAGCRKALEKHFTIEPVMPGSEGSPVTIEAGYDPSRITLTGTLGGAAPYKGTLRHRGWRVTAMALPERTAARDAGVVCPAEVDV